MTDGLRRSLLLLALPAALTLQACAATTYDDTLATSDTATASTTTSLPMGTVAELLPRLVEEAAALSAVMIAGGDAAAVVERADALWAAARPEVERDRPELLRDFDTNLTRMTTAVEFKRAADADKAAANLAVLVEFYLS